MKPDALGPAPSENVHAGRGRQHRRGGRDTRVRGREGASAVLSPLRRQRGARVTFSAAEGSPGRPPETHLTPTPGAWAPCPHGTRPACTHPEAQQEQILTVVESSLWVPTTLPSPTSAGGSEQTQSVVRHATSQGARGHTHTQQRPLLLRVWGNFLRVEEPESEPGGCHVGDPATRGWWEGGHTRAANGTFNDRNADMGTATPQLLSYSQSSRFTYLIQSIVTQFYT